MDKLFGFFGGKQAEYSESKNDIRSTGNIESLDDIIPAEPLPMPKLDASQKDETNVPLVPFVTNIKRPREGVPRLKIVCLSDTHNHHNRLHVPDGDILIHAGDATKRGSVEDVQSFATWLLGLPHRYKIIIAGNHDFLFEKQNALARQIMAPPLIYLQDDGVTIEGIKIWGSPWQPEFYNWAFNLERGQPLKEKWDMIPNDTDILITHGPPLGFGDHTSSGDYAGCEELREAIRNRVRPRVSIYGHIHEGYGVYEDDITTYINASICTLRYTPTNRPIVFEI